MTPADIPVSIFKPPYLDLNDMTEDIPAPQDIQREIATLKSDKAALESEVKELREALKAPQEIDTIYEELIGIMVSKFPPEEHGEDDDLSSIEYLAQQLRNAAKGHKL
jgi:hypothetical protein